MVRRLFGKVMWLGRATSALVGLVVLFALAIGAANSALAHTNVDTKLFHLGHNNPVAALSKLTGRVANGVLQVTNTSTSNTTQNATAIGATNNSVSSPAMRATNAGRGTALELNVTCPISSTCFKAAPMKVNSDTKVDNLNSDKLDGKDSSQFLGKTEKAADADTLDGKDSSAFVVTGNGKQGSFVNIDSCGSGPVLSYPLALTRSGRIFATAFSGYSSSSPGPETPSIRIELLDNSNTVVARSGRVLTSESGNPTLNISEVLLDVNGTAAYDAPAGNYTLRILADNFGTCAGFGQYQSPRLTHIVLAEG